MSKNILTAATALVALAAAGVAQTGNQVLLPVHSNVYNGFSRGYDFIAGSDFFIQDFELPVDAFQAGDTAGILIRVNGAIVFNTVGNAAAIMTPASPLQIFTGDTVAVVGNWSPATTNNFSAHNSYGGGPFASSIEGVATNLNRAGVQWDIGDPGGNTAANFGGLTGSIGRVWMYTTPPAGIFAGFTATPNSGASSLLVQFTDTTFTDDPGGVIAWDWDLDGDGTTDSNLQNPTFTYTTCGSYDVTLTATDVLNGSNTKTVVGAVQVDNVVASFTVAELVPGAGIWQFTDTSTPTPIAWAWDFDGDGTVDDVTQNPVYVQAVPSGLLSLPTCTLTVDGLGGCFQNTLVQNVQATGYGVVEVTTGGNGTSATPSVGTYSNIQVGAETINVTGLNTGVYGFAGGIDVSVFIRAGGHAGFEGQPNEWTLAATGTGTAAGTGTVGVPEMVVHTLSNSFNLPPGLYGMAIMHTSQAGTAMQVSYTSGPGAAPYGNADLTVHPLMGGAPTGCSTTSFLGGCAFQPRLWNGRIIYESCSVTGNASSGTYSGGCPNSAGVVPSLTPTSLPQIGGTYGLDVDSGLAAPAAVLVIVGASKDLYGGLPLPLDLAILGAPGCNLAASVDAADLLIAAPGANPWAFAIPNNPALSCFEFYQQAAVLDLPANAFGFVLSNATAAVVGN